MRTILFILFNTTLILIFPFLTLAQTPTSTPGKSLQNILLDSEARERLIWNNQTQLFLSDDGGQHWSELNPLPAINGSTYLTASARHPSNPSELLVGTSFNGIWESLDKGKTWKILVDSKGLKGFYQGNGFYDEVVAISYIDATSTDIQFTLGFGDGNYRFDRKKNTLKAITEPVTAKTLPSGVKAPGVLESETLPVAQIMNDTNASLARKALAKNRKGLYLNPNAASGKRLADHLNFAIQEGLNSIVVDFKDDQGFLTYESKLEIPQELKAVKDRIDAPALIARAHAKNIAVIARIVVFKDKQLSAYKKNAYSLWDRYTKKPWGVFKTSTPNPAKPDDKPTPVTTQTEWWVDPYAEFVRDYNVAIAKEIQALGVDEIQFDYIRFPSDGNVASIVSRNRLDSNGKALPAETPMDRVRALSMFLAKARDAIKIPISTDVFGFNGWARMSHLGQDIQAFSRYVDVIQPMNYPSHYPREFQAAMNYFDRASYIYSEGTRRARVITEDRVLIRPYVQSFLIGSETKFADAVFHDYLNRQVISAKSAGASGFTLWNNMGNYYMVDTKTFRPAHEN